MTTLESAMTAYVEAVRDGTEGVTVEMAQDDARALKQIGRDLEVDAQMFARRFGRMYALHVAPSKAAILDGLINAVCDQLAGGYEIGQSACALIRAAAEGEG